MEENQNGQFNAIRPDLYGTLAKVRVARETDKWHSVPTEVFREYVTADGKIYRIDNAQKFHVSPRGTHYVLDRDGRVHMLMKDQFMVVRIYDTKGIELTAPRDKA